MTAVKGASGNVSTSSGGIQPGVQSSTGQLSPGTPTQMDTTAVDLSNADQDVPSVPANTPQTTPVSSQTLTSSQQTTPTGSQNLDDKVKKTPGAEAKGQHRYKPYGSWPQNLLDVGEKDLSTQSAR